PISTAAPYYGLNAGLFKAQKKQHQQQQQQHPRHHRKSNAVDSPELNLGWLFADDQQPQYSAPLKAASTKKSGRALQHKHEPFNAPAHLIHAPNKPAQHTHAAPARHSKPPVIHATSRPRRQEPRTPEMNLGWLFKEDETPAFRSLPKAHEPSSINIGQMSNG
ncbi:hypothetical protein BGZ94_006726, partial [Podila epigama]